ncbi:hypothetical protein D3C71_1317460 [compost metagenome]
MEGGSDLPTLEGLHNIIVESIQVVHRISSGDIFTIFEDSIVIATRSHEIIYSNHVDSIVSDGCLLFIILDEFGYSFFYWFCKVRCVLQPRDLKSLDIIASIGVFTPLLLK